jgi:hypothetical protein
MLLQFSNQIYDECDLELSFKLSKSTLRHHQTYALGANMYKQHSLIAGPILKVSIIVVEVDDAVSTRSSGEWRVKKSGATASSIPQGTTTCVPPVCPPASLNLEDGPTNPASGPALAHLWKQVSSPPPSIISGLHIYYSYHLDNQRH